MNMDAAEFGFRADLFVGRKVLIIGGTSGIGFAIGQAFARHAAEVCMTGATEPELAAARPLVAGASIELRQLDVRHDESVRALIAEYPALDVLVNCAGIIRRGEEHDPATFAQVIDINLSGTMRTCAAARTALGRSRG